MIFGGKTRLAQTNVEISVLIVCFCMMVIGLAAVGGQDGQRGLIGQVLWALQTTRQGYEEHQRQRLEMIRKMIGP